MTPAPPAHRALQILGHPLTMELPASLEEWVRDRWIFPYSREERALITLRRGTVDAPVEPVRIAYEETFGEVADDADNLIASFNGCRVALRWGSTIAITIDDAGEEKWAQLLLQFAFSEILRRDGLLFFHSSVVSRSGMTVALLAPSGTGKSTTLFDAIRRGASPVCEDGMWLDATTRQVYGWDREIRLWQDSVDRFAGSLPPARQWRADGKTVYSFEELGWNRAERVTLDRIVLLRRDLTRPSSWSMPSEIDVIRSLWESSGFSYHKATRDSAQGHVGLLCRTMRFAQLTIGNTPINFDAMFAPRPG